MNLKKGLLIFFMLPVAALHCFSQSLLILTHNGPLEPNSTIIQPGTTDSSTLNTYLNVMNTANHPINILCKKTEIMMQDSTQTFMCWAGYCYAPWVYQSYNAQPVAAGQTYTGFKGIYAQVSYNPFTIGESMVRWVFFDESDAADSVAVTVIYTTYPVGIGDEQGSQAFIMKLSPNPASAEVKIRYSAPSATRVSIRIRDLTGIRYEVGVPSGHSKIATVNTLDLPRGLYFCSLLVEGETIVTKKLLVVH